MSQNSIVYELLADSGPDDEGVKTEIKGEPEVKVEADVKTEQQTVEEVDQLDLDEIDESSCHSWTEPVLSGKREKKSSVFRPISIQLVIFTIISSLKVYNPAFHILI